MSILRMIMGLVSLISGKKRREEDLSVPSVKKDPEIHHSISELLYKSDSSRLETEHQGLKTENKPLYDLIEDLASFCLKQYNKNIVITMIGRTNQEQDEIYAGKERNGRKYDENPWKSPHQFSHAVDIRSRIFTKEEIKEIEDYLNAKYNPNNYYSFTAKNHNVGLGDHFHIQFYKV